MAYSNAAKTIFPLTEMNENGRTGSSPARITTRPGEKEKPREGMCMLLMVVYEICLW